MQKERGQWSHCWLQPTEAEHPQGSSHGAEKGLFLSSEPDYSVPQPHTSQVGFNIPSLEEEAV